MKNRTFEQVLESQKLYFAMGGGLSLTSNSEQNIALLLKNYY